MIQKQLLAAAFICLPFTAFAVGGESDVPPESTETTVECTEGQIYDEKTKSCVDASDDNAFNDDTRHKAVRELAYAGAYERALSVLASVDNHEDARFLNYHGFIQRKQGNWNAAKGFYKAALTADPDYHLARSYLGQGLVAQGDRASAMAQLKEISARGGKGTWAYTALKLALRGQGTLDY